MIFIAFGRWSSAHGRWFTRERIYYKGYRWTPFARISRRYYRAKGIGPRQNNVAAAAVTLDHILSGIQLYLREPIDDLGEWWRVSGDYYRDGVRYGLKTKWHQNAEMTVLDLIEVFAALRNKFVALDQRTVWLDTSAIVRNSTLYEIVDDGGILLEPALPSSAAEEKENPMKASFVFAGKTRLEVRWTGTNLPKLERELEELFAKYGLEFTGSGYDLIERERTLVFRPLVEDE